MSQITSTADIESNREKSGMVTIGLVSLSSCTAFLHSSVISCHEGSDMLTVDVRAYLKVTGAVLYGFAGETIVLSMPFSFRIFDKYPLLIKK